MLSCKDVTARATALVDGELGAWEVLQIRLHLAMCKGCTAFVDQMRATRALIREASQTPGGEAERAGIDTILTRLHDEKQQGE